MLILGIFVIMFIGFVIISKRLNNKSNIKNRMKLESYNNQELDEVKVNQELDEVKVNQELDKTKGITRDPKAAYFVLGFFGFFTFFSVLFLIIVLTSYEFSRLGFIITSIFVTVGLVAIFFIIKSIIYNNRLYDHLKNGTILEKKAIVTKFKYFKEAETDTRIGRSGYIIVANIGEQKYKSKKIDILIYGAEGEDIDKAFYEKKGIPYSPKDPSYNDDYKKRIDAKIKEIDAQIAGLGEELEHTSRFKKNKIRKEIAKLWAEKVWTEPKALPYNGKLYYIGDEITVFVTPDNPKNYIM